MPLICPNDLKLYVYLVSLLSGEQFFVALHYILPRIFLLTMNILAFSRLHYPVL